jgi:hypothetical protein
LILFYLNPLLLFALTACDLSFVFECSFGKLKAPSIEADSLRTVFLPNSFNQVGISRHSFKFSITKLARAKAPKAPLSSPSFKASFTALKATEP